MGPDIAPALFVVNPIPPYNTTSEYYANTLAIQQLF
jgi:hypothetical protein